MHLGAIALGILTLVPFIGAADAPVVKVLDLKGLSTEEKAVAYALAGLLNREQPRVFLRGGLDVRWSSLMLEPEKKEHGENWDAATKAQMTTRFGADACTEDLWLERFTATGRFRFVQTALPDLLRSATVLKGCILYDNLREDCSPAATLAGLEDAVPLTAPLREQFAAAGVALPVVVDYTAIRAAFPAGTDRRLEGHRWAIATLLPRCSRTGTVSRDRTYGLDVHDTLVDIDQAVQKRWFVYDLDHTAVANRVDGKDQDPPDRELLDAILGHAAPFSPVFGWGRPEECHFTRSVGRNRQVVVCSGVLNNSFFAALPSTRTTWKQKHQAVMPETVVPESRIYVALMVNEGDSVKEAISLQGMGGWTQPQRGTIPINWGMDPLLCTTHPGLMDYYYDTMSEQDYFFAAAAGWGYVHPGFMEPAMVNDYADMVRRGGALGDLRYIDVWWMGGIEQQDFLRRAGMRGLTLWDGGEQSVRYADGGAPVIHGNNYYTFTQGPESFAETLIADMKEVQAPWFVIVYGAFDHATPYRFSEMARRLPRERFKVVLLDEFFSVAERSRAAVEKRVWKPGPNAPKGVAP
jgi:hypothetical protein